jgi:hypothetical protein
LVWIKAMILCSSKVLQLRDLQAALLNDGKEAFSRKLHFDSGQGHLIFIIWIQPSSVIYLKINMFLTLPNSSLYSPVFSTLKRKLALIFFEHLSLENLIFLIFGDFHHSFHIPWVFYWGFLFPSELGILFQVKSDILLDIRKSFGAEDTCTRTWSQRGNHVLSYF